MGTTVDKEFGTIGGRRAGTTAEKGFAVGEVCVDYCTAEEGMGVGGWYQ